MALYRVEPGLPRIGFRLNRLGSRALDRTPVIENLRNVYDPTRALGHAHYQVVVLGPCLTDAEATDVPNEGRAQDRKVSCVHLPAQPLRGPLRLDEGIKMASIKVDLVFVRVQVIDIRLTCDLTGHPGE